MNLTTSQRLDGACDTLARPSIVVLIAEVEPGLHRLLRHTLRDEGVEMMIAGSVTEALNVLAGSTVDVAVIGEELPDGSGLEVLDQLRRSGSRAHSIVTGSSTSEDGGAEAIARGAHEYLATPFPIHELTTRILALRPPDPDRDHVLRAGTLTVELGAHQARIGDRLLELTGKEFDLLTYLLARPGQVFSRDQLLHEVWHSTAEWQQAATVTEHIRRLRSKIESDPRRPTILRTVHGAGYRLDVPEERRVGTDDNRVLGPGTVIHVDGRIVCADEAAAAIFGMAAPSDLVGQLIAGLVTTTFPLTSFERLAIERPGTERRTQLIELERGDRPRLTVEVSSKEFHWEGHRARHLTLAPVRDLSARLLHLATEVLSEVTDAVIINDLHLHVRSWNEAAERLYGWRQDEVLGRHILDVVQWISDDTDPHEIWDTLVRTSSWKGTGQQVTRDGAMINVMASTTLIRDDSREPVAIVSINRLSPAAAEDAPPTARRAPVQKL